MNKNTLTFNIYNFSGKTKLEFFYKHEDSLRYYSAGYTIQKYQIEPIFLPFPLHITIA